MFDEGDTVMTVKGKGTVIVPEDRWCQVGVRMDHGGDEHLMHVTDVQALPKAERSSIFEIGGEAEGLETRETAEGVKYISAVGEGCVEQAAEMSAAEAKLLSAMERSGEVCYQGYARSLSDVGHHCPDWHQLPDCLKDAFIVAAGEVVNMKGGADGAWKHPSQKSTL